MVVTSPTAARDVLPGNAGPKELCEAYARQQEQLVQTGKLAPEIVVNAAHEQNDPLNDAGLFAGNASGLTERGTLDKGYGPRALPSASQRVRKASGITAYLRMFGPVAYASLAQAFIIAMLQQALSLVREQFRHRQVGVRLDLCTEDQAVLGGLILPIRQVFINLLTNVRDAVATSLCKIILFSRTVEDGAVPITLYDVGSSILAGLGRPIFDLFFISKQAGTRTGSDHSITQGIITEHLACLPEKVAPASTLYSSSGFHLAAVMSYRGNVSYESDESLARPHC